MREGTIIQMFGRLQASCNALSASSEANMRVTSALITLLLNKGAITKEELDAAFNPAPAKEPDNGN